MSETTRDLFQWVAASRESMAWRITMELRGWWRTAIPSGLVRGPAGISPAFPVGIAVPNWCKGKPMKKKFGYVSWSVLLVAGSLALMVGSQQEAAQTGKVRFEMKTESGDYKYTNRLAGEKSPYLLQHAHNPVDWYPWGEEAFEKARKENKPIFLSIGYSTCHWCHVMERESFENPAIAKILNEHFFSIKVDREERPDVDRVYMTFVQATTGGGGWPMSVWLTPDLKPFMGGTYFPPEDRWGQMGFSKLLGRIADGWREDRERILSSGSQMIEQLREHTAREAVGSGSPDASVIENGYRQIKSLYEPDYGGFGGAPKFPRPVSLNLMLRYYARTGTQDALDMSLFTLRKMADGGMHDHLGGGFHRYSTDTRWHVPHFEKMLYDQAQLVFSYLEAYQITREERFADVARGILRYVQRDMMGSAGQFYSAEDADSPIPGNVGEHAEGAFYVWEQGEIEAALPKDQAEVFSYYYGVEKGGNVRSDPHKEFPNKNVLIISRTLEETAKRFETTEQGVSRLLATARGTLFDLRAKRPRPHLDDKTLTAWNGLMISAFARAHQVLGDAEFLAAATKSAGFIREHLMDHKRNVLLRRFRAGAAAIDGYVDDYAFLIQGLIDLYEASFDIDQLNWAIDLQARQDALFGDAEHGGYFSTTGSDPSVLLRMKEDYDGAEPSPNSVAALNLVRLAQMTDRAEYRERAVKAFSAFSNRLENAPSAMPQMLVALGFHLSKPRQIVIAGQPAEPGTLALLRVVHHPFIPNKILLLADGGPGQASLGRSLDFIKTVRPLEGKPTAYICENYVCQLPTSDPEQVAKLLAPKR
jgi:uncharacterized protein